MGLTKLTTEEFIARARSVHGNKFDYSQVIYRGMHSSVRIICPRHGQFIQHAQGHLTGRGCAYCSNPQGNEVFEFIAKLNMANGWHLVGGNHEYGVPSGVTASSKYYFDGADLEKLIFFEYNWKPHHFEPIKSRDAFKKQKLKEWLASEGLTGKATYVVYDAVKEVLTQEVL